MTLGCEGKLRTPSSLGIYIWSVLQFEMSFEVGTRNTWRDKVVIISKQADIDLVKIR